MRIQDSLRTEVTKELVDQIEAAITTGHSCAAIACSTNISEGLVRIIANRLSQAQAQAQHQAERERAIATVAPKSDELRRRVQAGDAQEVLLDLAKRFPHLLRQDIQRLTGASHEKMRKILGRHRPPVIGIAEDHPPS